MKSSPTHHRRRVSRVAALVLGTALVGGFLANSTSAVAVSSVTPEVAAPAVAPANPSNNVGVPVPTVTGPIKTTATSHPFGGAAYTMKPENLAKIGYVEEEFFVSGKANVYTWTAAGPAVVRTSDAPYTTRMLVRRPVKAASFSGNVFVEPLNPSNMFDLNIGWGMMHDQLVKNGDVWIGFTSKPVAMQTLKTFDPVRYAPLQMNNPLPLTDPANCERVATDSSRTTENGLVWDMISQIGQLTRSATKSNPVVYDKSAPRSDLKVYGFGYSQTGGFMYNYINGVQPLVVKAQGKAVYDGYIVAVAGGGFAGAYPMNQCESAPPVSDVKRQFSNVGTPIIHVMSQSDYLSGIASRRLDSDAPSDRFRHYEMAGAGHATPDELYTAASPADIIKGGQSVPPMNCNEGVRSRFPSKIFFNAIARNLDLWVRKGIAPPHGSPIVVVNGAPVYDQHGNVLGGLRSPYLDVPTAKWSGSATGASFCFIAGYEVPFDKATLKSLYKNHTAYVTAVTKNVAMLVAQGYITSYDGAALIAEAAKANVP